MTGDTRALDALVRDRRLLVCVGPGGVGKTTVAAALGLEAARLGRRALVLTIDPARRLADALGLDGLDDRVRRVEVPEDLGVRGTLAAAMLETRASYDALVRRIAEPEHAERILDNRVYRAFSRTLARSHAYVALERLHAVEAAGEHDLVVLDTPPLRSALDILDAPGRLARFLDADIVRAFLDRVPAGAGADALTERELARASRRGAKGLALRLLSLVASRELVDEMVAFFSLFATLRQGFADRAAAIEARFRDESTAFVLVGSTGGAQLEDARFLRDGLVARGTPPRAVILNRAYEPEPGDPGTPVRAASEPRSPTSVARRLFDGAAPDEAIALLDALARLRADAAARNALGAARGHALVAPLGDDVARCRLPELDAPPADLASLRDLAALVRARFGRDD